MPERVSCASSVVKYLLLPSWWARNIAATRLAVVPRAATADGGVPAATVEGASGLVETAPWLREQGELREELQRRLETMALFDGGRPTETMLRRFADRKGEGVTPNQAMVRVMPQLDEFWGVVVRIAGDASGLVRSVRLGTRPMQRVEVPDGDRGDLDEGVLSWDYFRPYHIRQREDGYCVHHADEVSGGCTVHSQRPAVCRGYDCSKDARIWKDFDQMILADELADEDEAPPAP